MTVLLLLCVCFAQANVYIRLFAPNGYRNVEVLVNNGTRSVFGWDQDSGSYYRTLDGDVGSFIVKDNGNQTEFKNVEAFHYYSILLGFRRQQVPLLIDHGVVELNKVGLRVFLINVGEPLSVSRLAATDNATAATQIAARVGSFEVISFESAPSGGEFRLTDGSRNASFTAPGQDRDERKLRTLLVGNWSGNAQFLDYRWVEDYRQTSLRFYSSVPRRATNSTKLTAVIARQGIAPIMIDLPLEGASEFFSFSEIERNQYFSTTNVKIFDAPLDSLVYNDTAQLVKLSTGETPKMLAEISVGIDLYWAFYRIIVYFDQGAVKLSGSHIRAAVPPRGNSMWQCYNLYDGDFELKLATLNISTTGSLVRNNEVTCYKFSSDAQYFDVQVEPTRNMWQLSILNTIILTQNMTRNKCGHVSVVLIVGDAERDVPRIVEISNNDAATTFISACDEPPIFKTTTLALQTLPVETTFQQSAITTLSGPATPTATTTTMSTLSGISESTIVDSSMSTVLDAMTTTLSAALATTSEAFVVPGFIAIVLGALVGLLLIAFIVAIVMLLRAPNAASVSASAASSASVENYFPSNDDKPSAVDKSKPNDASKIIYGSGLAVHQYESSELVQNAEQNGSELKYMTLGPETTPVESTAIVYSALK